MNAKIGRFAARLAAFGPLLAVLFVLLAAWSVTAGDQVTDRGRELVQYEVVPSVGAAQLEIALPGGCGYVALAPGSRIAVEPRLDQNGTRAVWAGPFPEAEAVRFWLACQGAAAAPTTLSVVGASGDAVLVEPLARPAAVEGSETPGEVLAGTVTVTKTWAPAPAWPNPPYVIYEVVFSNSSTATVTLDRITDTLPAGFDFLNMAAGDEVGDPVDATEPEIVWTGATVPAAGSRTMRYLVEATDHAGEYQNSVVALAGGQTIGPASTTLRIEGHLIFLPYVARNFVPPRPVWQITKTANPTQVEPGEQVKYTVVIRNTGNLAGTLTRIEDALPGGFSFVAMQTGSEVTTPPQGTTGTIVWQGNWPLAPGASLTLIYTVQSGGGGDKVNTVTVYAGERPVGSGSATVTVGGGLPFEEDFANGVSADWVPFTNWPDLSPDHWYWAGSLGVYGLYNYDYQNPTLYQGYHIAIYNGSGAQGWTDYRVEARVKDVKDKDLKRGLVGVWFRGTYEDSGLKDGKTVAGYYVYMKAANEYLYLMRTPPDEPSFGAQTSVASKAFAPGIGRKHWYKIIVEVRGNNIKVWFEDDEDDVEDPILFFDWTDPNGTWTSGTVGLAVYNTSARFDYIRVLPLD